MPLLGNKSTPTTSRVRQAFKSPFRVPQTVQNQPALNIEGKTCLKNIDTNIESHPEKSKNDEEILNIHSKDQESQNSKSDINDFRTPKRKESSPKIGSMRKFKTPFCSPSFTHSPQSQHLSSEDHLNQLREKEAMLDAEIEALQKEGYKVEELQYHITALHSYNETKDAAQLVLGKLAEMEGITIAEMHQQYDVPTVE
ncbi:unnamed protein product [Meganyctiphanes norvegica]|uniref:DNA repair protein SWI5 homolog n=1 Tax=Meganyctiphanes norvegica TaxID=48144 RepID=A0AAV2QTR7_MEGNR